MTSDTLTKEQRDFAEKWHNLIYAYLNHKGLNEDEYYDIVVFGYLRAVRRYFEEEVLRQYAFSTIAWRCMSTEVKNEHIKRKRQKRSAKTISLNSLVYGDEVLLLEEALSTPDALMEQLEYQCLLHELAEKVSKRQMKIARMRADGHSLREISKAESLPMNRLKTLIDGIRVALCDIYGGVQLQKERW